MTENKGLNLNDEDIRVDNVNLKQELSEFCVKAKDVYFACEHVKQEIQKRGTTLHENINAIVKEFETELEAIQEYSNIHKNHLYDELKNILDEQEEGETSIDNRKFISLLVKFREQKNKLKKYEKIIFEKAELDLDSRFFGFLVFQNDESLIRIKKAQTLVCIKFDSQSFIFNKNPLFKDNEIMFVAYKNGKQLFDIESYLYNTNGNLLKSWLFSGKGSIITTWISNKFIFLISELNDGKTQNFLFRLNHFCCIQDYISISPHKSYNFIYSNDDMVFLTDRDNIHVYSNDFKYHEIISQATKNPCDTLFFKHLFQNSIVMMNETWIFVAKDKKIYRLKQRNNHTFNEEIFDLQHDNGPIGFIDNSYLIFDKVVPNMMLKKSIDNGTIMDKYQIDIIDPKQITDIKCETNGTYVTLWSENREVLVLRF